MLLSILIFLPLAGGIAGDAVPDADEDGGRRAGFVSLLTAAATLGLAIGLLADFDSGGGLQHVTDVDLDPAARASTTSSASTG